MSGVNLGRVTLAEAYGANTDIATLYVLISAPPAAVPITGGSVNFGTTVDGAPDDSPTGPTTFNNTPGIYGLYKNSGGALGNQAWTHVMLREQAGGASPDQPPFVNIDLTGVDASNSGAMIVDPTDPNVVYIGGSEEYPTGDLDNGLIRIDTGNMQDTTHADASGANQGIVNNGDDMTKRAAAWDTTGNPPEDKFEYPTVNDQGYLGEGVSWVDLTTNAFESDFSNQFGGATVPPDITSVAIDSQGRIVLGTEQGVYRLVYEGTGYDFTSGGDGIIVQKAAANPVGPGMGRITPPNSTIKLTSINGNLAIADLTSVAIDPSIPGRYYTTEYNTGTASITDGVNSGATQGLIGLNGDPDGDSVLVGAPDPTAAPGTLNTVYVEFAYNQRVGIDAFAYQPHKLRPGRRPEQLHRPPHDEPRLHRSSRLPARLHRNSQQRSPPPLAALPSFSTSCSSAPTGSIQRAPAPGRFHPGAQHPRRRHGVAYRQRAAATSPRPPSRRVPIRSSTPAPTRAKCSSP